MADRGETALPAPVPRIPHRHRMGPRPPELPGRVSASPPPRPHQGRRPRASASSCPRAPTRSAPTTATTASARALRPSRTCRAWAARRSRHRPGARAERKTAPTLPLLFFLASPAHAFLQGVYADARYEPGGRAPSLEELERADSKPATSIPCATCWQRTPGPAAARAAWMDMSRSTRCAPRLAARGEEAREDDERRSASEIRLYQGRVRARRDDFARSRSPPASRTSFVSALRRGSPPRRAR